MGFGGGAFGTGSYTYSVIDNQTIQLNQQKGIIYANATLSEIQNIVSQNGAISGTIAYSEPATGKYYKKFIAVLSNFQNQNPTNLLSNSGTSGIGEAPQLSSTYGQYDDGASVFNFYDNFAGTSLSSKWTQGIGSGGTITVNNGLTISSTTNYDTFVQSVSTFSVPIIAESYVTASAPTTNYERATVFIGTGSTTNQNVVSYGYFFEDVYASGQRWEIGDSSSSNYVATSTALNGILGGYWIASGNEQLYYNYAQQLTWTDTSQSPSATTVGLDVAGVSGGYSATFKWLRTRAYPPKGVMPSVSFGSFTSSSGASITIPSGIEYYMPITITNSQSSATPSPFQQMIQININDYSDYMYFDGNIANFEFFTSSGTIIPAWIESNNNGTLTIWVNLSSGIGANSSITIYLGVANTSYQFSINYPVPFTTEANIIYNSGITCSTTLNALTITLNSLQQMNGTIIVEGY